MFPNASHALLQEADVNLAQLMKQQGFYVTKRHMSAPVKKRTKSTFGSANPIEKPTMGELDYYTEGYTRSLYLCVGACIATQPFGCKQCMLVQGRLYINKWVCHAVTMLTDDVNVKSSLPACIECMLLYACRFADSAVQYIAAIK